MMKEGGGREEEKKEDDGENEGRKSGQKWPDGERRAAGSRYDGPGRLGDLREEGDEKTPFLRESNQAGKERGRRR